MSTILPDWEVKLSPDCKAKRDYYENNLFEKIGRAEELERPSQEVEVALAEYLRFVDFGTAIDRLQEEGRDPRATLRATKKAGIFLLKFPPWRCYFDRDVSNKHVLGILLFHKDDKPIHLAEVLGSISRQWLE